MYLCCCYPGTLVGGVASLSHVNSNLLLIFYSVPVYFVGESALKCKYVGRVCVKKIFDFTLNKYIPEVIHKVLLEVNLKNGLFTLIVCYRESRGCLDKFTAPPFH